MPLTSAIIQAALQETGIQPPGEPIDATDAAWGLEKLNRLIDQWNAQREKIFNVTFSRFTLIPNHSPHTIGPTGDFKLPVRPVSIVSANFVLTNSGSAVDYPLQVLNDQQWADVRLKDLTSSISRMVYYSPDVPLGNLYFWPVPTSVNDVRLETWLSLTQPASLNTVLMLPPGYWEALVLTLAMKFCASHREPPPPTLVADQKEAMRAIVGNNSQPPLIRTDSGMGSRKRSGRPDFYFPTGEPW